MELAQILVYTVQMTAISLQFKPLEHLPTPLLSHCSLSTYGDRINVCSTASSSSYIREWVISLRQYVYFHMNSAILHFSIGFVQDPHLVYFIDSLPKWTNHY